MGQDVTLRPYDRIRVSSTGELAIAGERSLGEDGSIEFGTRAKIYLAGRSLAEAAAEIKRTIGLPTGSVGVQLVAPTNGSVSFRGAVKRSGTLNLRTPKSIGNVIELAELTDAADRNGVIVISALGKTYRVDVDANPDFPMRPGDQVLVPQLSVANEVLVLGAVNKPGSLPFKSGLTMEQAIDQAGGLTGHAILNQIAVVRKDNPVAGADWSAAGRKTVLQRGDVVRVASQENGRYVSILGHVKTAGLVPFRPGMTLMEALEAAGGTIVGAGRDAVEVRKVFGGRGSSKKYDLNLLTKGSKNDPKLQAADVVFVPAFVFKETKQPASGFRPVVPPRRSR